MMMKDMKSLRELTDNGFVGFSIKARDNDFNVDTLDDFRLFCKGYTDGNYTLGLSLLLAYYEERQTYSLLYDKIEELGIKVAELEEQLKEQPAKEDEGDELF